MLETKDFMDFSITTWYENFKHVSVKTIIIELPDSFIKKVVCNGESEVEDTEENCSDFEEKVKNAFNAFDKNVFIKNNWHAPTDARMFSFGNLLKACSMEDVLLYFTTSTIIQDDFTSAKSIPFCLALRKWLNIHPAAEFRCIVVNNILRGITPRDWPTFYAHFKQEGPQIIDKLTNFFNENIKLRFPRKNYVVDIVVSYPDEPFILDFGPLNSKTNLYAFTWKEIQSIINKDSPEDIPSVFRYLETDIGIMTRADALNKFARSQME